MGNTQQFFVFTDMRNNGNMINNDGQQSLTMVDNYDVASRRA